MLSAVHKTSNNQWGLLHKHWEGCLRLRKYALYGTSLTIVGLGVLYLLVSHLSTNVFLAQMVIAPAIMAVVSYIVHRRGTFGDREILKPYNKTRYILVRLAGMGVAKVSFLMLVAVAGMQFLLASLIITAVLAGPTYKANRDWAFSQQISRKAEKA